MNKDKRIVDFADRWLQCYTDLKTFESEFGEECLDMGFNLEDGYAFADRIGNKAYNDSKELEKALSGYIDAHMLGSGILYRWRRITHWIEEDLLSDKNREWFKVAFTRLKEIG